MSSDSERRNPEPEEDPKAIATGSTLAAAWHALDGVGLRPTAAVVLAAVTAPGSEPSEGLNSGWRTD